MIRAHLAMGLHRKMEGLAVLAPVDGVVIAADLSFDPPKHRRDILSNRRERPYDSGDRATSR